MFISIAGTIGAGKTTLAEQLSKLLNLPIYYEPVKDNIYLEEFYSDMKSVAFSMQIYLLNKRFEQQQQIIWQGKGGVQDRTIYEDGIFAKMLKDSGVISQKDYDTYISLFNNLSNFMKKPTIIIWLDVSAEKSFERIKKRGREFEKTITLEYLTDLNKAYDVFMEEICKTTPVLKIDWNEDNLDVNEIAKKVQNKINNLASIVSL